MHPWFRPLVVLAMGVGAAQAACLTDAQVAGMVEAMAAMKPAANPDLRTEADAAIKQARTPEEVLDAASGARPLYEADRLVRVRSDAVVWLADALAKDGLAMQPGELISLGSFSALLPPGPGPVVTATYHGLPGAQPVSVRFE